MWVMHTGERYFYNNHMYEKPYSHNCIKKKKKLHSEPTWESRQLQMCLSCNLAGHPWTNVTEKSIYKYAYNIYYDNTYQEK